MCLKLVHDTEGKQLNFHDLCPKPGPVSGAGIRRDGMAHCFWGAHSVGERCNFAAPATRCPAEWGPRFLDFIGLYEKIRNSNFSMFSYKTTLPIFKCWQLIQIYINHCVGQTKHAWRLNLVHRPPVFNLCSRRRTEFQLGWKQIHSLKQSSWDSETPPTPPLYSCKPGREGIRALVLEREGMGEGALWWAVGVPATWLQAGWGEGWLGAGATVEIIKGVVETMRSDCTLSV